MPGISAGTSYVQIAPDFANFGSQLTAGVQHASRQVAPTPEQLRQIEDPLARIKAARAAEAEVRQEAHESYLEVTAEEVRELLASRTLALVGEMLGVSAQRVHQMSRAER